MFGVALLVIASDALMRQLRLHDEPTEDIASKTVRDDVHARPPALRSVTFDMTSVAEIIDKPLAWAQQHPVAQHSLNESQWDTSDLKFTVGEQRRPMRPLQEIPTLRDVLDQECAALCERTGWSTNELDLTRALPAPDSRPERQPYFFFMAGWQ
ncbi:MAG TPA: hypothetical protein VHV77_10365 [Pirellulales bacterium]|jgi:hypothetical protein|nr:hypothetical protein [Pirellulales bacterium]